MEFLILSITTYYVIRYYFMEKNKDYKNLDLLLLTLPSPLLETVSA